MQGQPQLFRERPARAAWRHGTAWLHSSMAAWRHSGMAAWGACRTTGAFHAMRPAAHGRLHTARHRRYGCHAARAPARKAQPETPRRPAGPPALSRRQISEWFLVAECVPSESIARCGVAPSRRRRCSRPRPLQGPGPPPGPARPRRRGAAAPGRGGPGPARPGEGGGVREGRHEGRGVFRRSSRDGSGCVEGGTDRKSVV